MRNIGLACLVVLLFNGGLAFGQQTTPKPVVSHKYRTLLTIAGGGGGFTAGVFVGLVAFDDAVNSDRKVWTTAIVGAAGGAIGGYFIGRHIDGRRKKTAVVTPILSDSTKGVQFAIRF